MDDKDIILANQILELRRGTLVLIVLNQLTEPVYGYSLIQELSARGVTVESNTLYHLLRRLQKQGLVFCQWENTDNKPRKYYMRNVKGTYVYEELKKQWSEMADRVNRLLFEPEADGEDAGIRQ